MSSPAATLNNNAPRPLAASIVGFQRQRRILAASDGLISCIMGDDGMKDILFGLFYLIAIAVVVLHFTGWLEDHDMEWLAFVMAVLVFPVVFLL